MPDRTALAYTYDGSFEGLLCCVFESYERKEIPFDIYPVNGEQGLLFASKHIGTDPVKAGRVYDSIPKRISQEALELVESGFLTCWPRKEMLLLEFLRLGFARGRQVMDMLADEPVHALRTAVQRLSREAGRYKGFVRFSVHGGVMAAVIEPDNQVLPLLMDHFCDRYRNEAFLIYDRTHRMVLAHRPGESGIFPMDEFVIPEPDDAEEEYRRLWKTFYDTVAIEGRINHRLRMSHMPRKYWSHISEMNAGPSGLRRSEGHGTCAAEEASSRKYSIAVRTDPSRFE